MIFLRVETQKASLCIAKREFLLSKQTIDTNEIHNEHSANRRSRFIVLIFSFNHTNTFLFPRPHFRFIEYTFSFHRIYIYSHHRTRIYSSSYTHFRSTFRGCIQICGHDKSVLTAAYRLSKYCERIIKMQHSRYEIRCEHFVNTQHLQCKNADTTLQNYCICKTIVTI